MWYVIQTQTGREQELTECIERVLKGNGYRACFVIEQECVWRNAGELLEHQKPLFPSYVIADTDTPEEFFLALKRVPKLSKLLRTDCEFWAIREEEKKLLCQMMELDECLVRLFQDITRCCGSVYQLGFQKVAGSFLLLPLLLLRS